MVNDSPEYETNPSDPSSKKQQHYRISVLWKRIGMCVCTVLMVYGAVRLIGYFNDLHRSRQTTQELREALAEAQTAESSRTRTRTTSLTRNSRTSSRTSGRTSPTRSRTRTPRTTGRRMKGSSRKVRIPAKTRSWRRLL